MKRSTIACDRLIPYAFVHRVFRFSSRKSLFFAKLFNALSLSLSSSPRYSLDFFYFFSPFLIFFENRSRLKSGCLSRILKLLIQLVFSIKGDKIFLLFTMDFQPRYRVTLERLISLSLFLSFKYICTSFFYPLVLSVKKIQDIRRMKGYIIQTKKKKTKRKESIFLRIWL